MAKRLNDEIDIVAKYIEHARDHVADAPEVDSVAIVASVQSAHGWFSGQLQVELQPLDTKHRKTLHTMKVAISERIGSNSTERNADWNQAFRSVHDQVVLLAIDVADVFHSVSSTSHLKVYVRDGDDLLNAAAYHKLRPELENRLRVAGLNPVPLTAKVA